MKRREFITLLGGAAAAWPIGARAQQAGKVWRIGYVAGVSRSAASGSYAAFVQGMRELGYDVERILSSSGARWREGTNDFPKLRRNSCD